MDIHLGTESGQQPQQSQQSGYLLNQEEIDELTAEFEALIESQYGDLDFSNANEVVQAETVFLELREFFLNENNEREANDLPALEVEDIYNVLKDSGMFDSLSDENIDSLAQLLHKSITGMTYDEFMKQFYDGMLMLMLNNLGQTINWVLDAGKD